MRTLKFLLFVLLIAPLPALAECSTVFADNGVASVTGCKAEEMVTAHSLDSGLLIEARARLCMNQKGEIRSEEGPIGAFKKMYTLKCLYAGKEKPAEGILITGTRVYTFGPLR
jgi:hypothetical protein